MCVCECVSCFQLGPVETERRQLPEPLRNGTIADHMIPKLISENLKAHIWESQWDNMGSYVLQDSGTKQSWLRLMCVQTATRRCPLTTLPAGNLFSFKIWVNSRRYASPRASSNTVGLKRVFNFHTLNFKCRPFRHTLTARADDALRVKVKALLYSSRCSKQYAC